MRRTDRLFELIQLFRGGRLWRGCDLAERLEVSLRTVYRDIDTLVASGVPIEGERGVGYILREPIFLPPLTLTTVELEALHLGIAAVSRSGDGELAQAAARLMEKVDAVLPQDRRGGDFAAGVGLYAPAPEGQLAFLPALRAAIGARRVIAMRYRRLDGKMTERQVSPLHLEYWGRVWTLTGWCRLRDDFRAFRVDHIVSLETTGETFRDAPGRRYSDYLARMEQVGGAP